MPPLILALLVTIPTPARRRYRHVRIRRGNHDRLIKERANALLALPEVRAAIDAAGGIGRFALAHFTA